MLGESMGENVPKSSPDHNETVKIVYIIVLLYVVM